MAAFVTAGGGFLLSVLWFDLMFDVQLLGRNPDNALGSISAYYRRVTTTARPMTWLVAVVMLATLVAIVVELARDDAPRWAAWTSLGLAGAAIGVALFATVPRAIRLGAAKDGPDVQRQLAHSILREHVACAVAIAALLVVQLGFAT